MSEIPNFTAKPEIEQLLEQEPHQLDFDTLIEVQKYKSKKLQAKRDAGVSDSKPGWTMVKPGDFNSINAKTTVDQTDSTETESKSKNKEAKKKSPGEHKSEPKESLSADDQVEYYKNLKKDLKTLDSESQETSSSVSTKSDSESPNQSNNAQTATEPKTEAPASDSGITNLSTGFSQNVLEHIRELEQKIDDYHRLTLELKDQIADLRVEKARLKEQ